MFRSLAKQMLGRVGLAPKSSVDQLSTRLQKSVTALERAQEQLHATSGARAGSTHQIATLRAHFEKRLATQGVSHIRLATKR